MNSSMSCARSRASRILRLAPLIALSVSFAGFSHAGGHRPYLDCLESEMPETCAEVSQRQLKSMAQKAKTKKSGPNGAKSGTSAAQRRALRHAEEAAWREAERETQRRLDQIILEQLLRDAGRR